MSPLTATVTRPVSLDTAVLVIDEFASSTSLNTFDRSIALSAASSATVTSDKAFTTTGGSSAPVTVTSKVSFASCAFEVPVTVIVAVPFWSAW